MKQEDKIKCSFSDIPFETALSFEYLINEIENIADNSGHPLNILAQNILKEIDKIPELKGNINDFNIVRDNRKLVEKLMSFVFNPLEDDQVLSSASEPFNPKRFFYSSFYTQNFSGENKKLEPSQNFQKSNVLLTMIYQAYLLILKKFFDFDSDIEVPFTYQLTDESNNTVKYYKMLVNSKYVDIKAHGRIKKLSTEELNSLFDHSTDLDYWNEKIPLNKFEFTGFLKFTYIDITNDYIISQLKTMLLDKEAIVLKENFDEIKDRIRALLEIPDLEIGLAAFSNFDSNINQNVIWKSIIPRSELSCKEYENTVYQKAYEGKSPVLTADVEKIEQNKMTNILLNKGIKNHAIIPLILEDEIVGMMELGAKNARQITMYQLKRLYELFPVFAVALKRSKEELTDKIRSIIQEEFTTIHPTVEWRFREAASTILNDRVNQVKTKLEPIIFNDVVPIYGASDIRGSSIERNHAIQADLLEHLGMAKNILNNCMKDKEMPLLDHLAFKVNLHLKTVKAGLKAGDEVSILEFLKKEIEPVFKQLKNRDIADKSIFEEYFNKMDPDLKVLYKKRRDFEESLMKINDIVGGIVDDEQIKAQEIFPHYFEKYRTDGVEYNAYIGQSLVKDIPYDKIYLKNIRLWQLLVKVKAARKIREYMPKLKTKLDITQLILVHSNPLAIAFRQDEKKFDVAGAYNIRYEITKKRIDKALINGTNERVTQVGKIAIIYSHAEEIEEYRKYIDYMISKKYLKETVENLELEDLTGASGLRALRVEVDFGTKSKNTEEIMDEVKHVFENVEA